MNAAQLVMLVCLAAFWGSSFLFLRLAVPAMGPYGPALVTELRLVLASFVLISFFSLRKMRFQLRKNWRPYLGIGLLNTAVPFTLFAAAAYVLPAGVMVILNGTVPLIGALLSRIVLGERLTARRLFGLSLGMCGVSCVVYQAGVGSADPRLVAAGVLACLAGSVCYALAAVMIKVHAAKHHPMLLATGSNFFAALACLPVLLLAATHDQGFPHPAWPVWIYISILGLGSTAVAYVLYFKLVSDLGPTRASTVTFLMPLFGMLWGALFIGEKITPLGLVGCGLILVGVRFVLGVPRAPRIRN